MSTLVLMILGIVGCMVGMVQPQQNQQQSGEWGYRESFNLAHLVASAHATCVSVFFRMGYGEEALGWNGLFALILMLAFAALGRVPEMFAYFGVWLLALIIQRLITFRLIHRGVVIHSQYQGYPLAAVISPAISERVARMLVEPGLCLAAGAILWLVSPPLGGFVMAGCVSLLFTLGVQQEIQRKRLQRMRDGEIEQKYLARRFRGGDR